MYLMVFASSLMASSFTAPSAFAAEVKDEAGKSDAEKINDRIATATQAKHNRQIEIVNRINSEAVSEADKVTAEDIGKVEAIYRNDSAGIKALKLALKDMMGDVSKSKRKLLMNYFSFEARSGFLEAQTIFPPEQVLFAMDRWGDKGAQGLADTFARAAKYEANMYLKGKPVTKDQAFQQALVEKNIDRDTFFKSCKVK